MKNYAGIPDEFAQEENALTVLIPVPYDGTSTWVKGADKGPDAFLDASENMELYDIETDTEVYKTGVYLTEPVHANESPDAMVAGVYERVKHYIAMDKFVTLFGGEHSVSIGAIRAHEDNYKDLTVLQLDAHTDLRPEYEGSLYNHACAVYEASQTCNLIQVGIRSMDHSELQYMNKAKVYFAHDISGQTSWMEESVSKMTENVYITVDLDVFDPSIMPSTGTPEPGGMTYYEVINYLKMVFTEKNVVGFDIVELCPNEMDKSSDFLAAKLYYKMLTYKYHL